MSQRLEVLRQFNGRRAALSLRGRELWHGLGPRAREGRPMGRAGVALCPGQHRPVRRGYSQAALGQVREELLHQVRVFVQLDGSH